MILRTILWSLISAAALTFAASGCSGPASSTDAGHDDHGHNHDGHDHGDHGDHKHDDHASAGHDHSEWWCAEHGVPEEECGQCSAKVAAALRKKGDWCDEHDRPDSQCFVCHPEYEAKFAARYEARYGKAPPKMN
jgi:hypothetical protein